MHFNIIFTPHTASFLSIFTLSLLKRTSCSYRLIANGCTTKDLLVLRKLANNYDNAELMVFPAENLVWQYEVLNYLRKISKREYFCFMDSDIFSTGDFTTQFYPLLNQYDAIFSCKPLWNDLNSDLFTKGGMAGRKIKTPEGFDLGCTYFSIYNKSALDTFVSKTAIDFRKYKWAPRQVHPELPKVYKKMIENKKAKAKGYDSGKVLNIVYQLEGNSVCYEEADHLWHLGGTSTYFSLAERNALHRTIGLHDLIIEPPKEKYAKYFFKIINDFLSEEPSTSHSTLPLNRKLEYLENELKFFLEENKLEILEFVNSVKEV